MPIVMCQLHGYTGASHGCHHVAEAVWARRPPGPTTLVDLDGVFFLGLVCDACLDMLNSKGLQAYLKRKETFRSYPPEGEIDPLLDLLDLQPMCGKCFEELAHQES